MHALIYRKPQMTPAIALPTAAPAPKQRMSVDAYA